MNTELLIRQIKCVEREINKRNFVYPKLIAAQKLTPAKAKEEIDLMEGIKDLLQSIKDKTAPTEVQQALFDMSQFKVKTSNRGIYD